MVDPIILAERDRALRVAVLGEELADEYDRARLRAALYGLETHITVLPPDADVRLVEVRAPPHPAMGRPARAATLSPHWHRAERQRWHGHSFGLGGLEGLRSSLHMRRDMALYGGGDNAPLPLPNPRSPTR